MTRVGHAAVVLVVISMLTTAIPAIGLAEEREAAEGSWSRGTGVITIDQQLLAPQIGASLTWDRLLPPGCLVYQTSYPALDVEDLPRPKMHLWFDLDERVFSGVVSGKTGFGELGADADGAFRLAITQGTMTPDGHDWILKGNGIASLGYAMTTTCVTSPKDSTPIERSRRTRGGGAVSIGGKVDLGADAYELSLNATQGTAEKQFRLWIDDVVVGQWEPEPIPEPSDEPEVDEAAETLQGGTGAAALGSDGQIQANSLSGRSRKDLGLFLLIVALAGGEDLLVDTLLEWNTGPYERHRLDAPTGQPPGGAEQGGTATDEAPDETGQDHPHDLVIEPPGGALDLMDVPEASTGTPAPEPADPTPSEPPSYAPGTDADAGLATSGPATDPVLDDAEAERIAAAILESMDLQQTKELQNARHRENILRTVRGLIILARSEQAAERRSEEQSTETGPAEQPLEDPVSPWTDLTKGEEEVLNLFWRGVYLQAAAERRAMLTWVTEALEEDEWAYRDKVLEVLVKLDSDD